MSLTINPNITGSRKTHCNCGVVKSDAYSPPPGLYDKINCLIQTKAVTSSHDESTSAPSLLPQPQDNMSMEECQAYGVTMTVTKNQAAPSLPPRNIEMEECKAYDVVARNNL